MRKLIAAVVGIALGLGVASNVNATEPEPRLRVDATKHVTWEETGCWIHVHAKSKRETAPRYRPQNEMHTQCTVNTGGYIGSGVTFRYRYPEWGIPTSFGVIIEEDGHGWIGDAPYVRAWQDPERPKVGYLWVPGPHADREHGTYIHVVYVVWNGGMHDAVKVGSFLPYG